MFTLGRESVYDALFEEMYAIHETFDKLEGGFGFKTIEEARTWQDRVNADPEIFGLPKAYYAVYELEGCCEIVTELYKGYIYPSITKPLKVKRKV